MKNLFAIAPADNFAHFPQETMHKSILQTHTTYLTTQTQNFPTDQQQLASCVVVDSATSLKSLYRSKSLNDLSITNECDPNFSKQFTSPTIHLNQEANKLVDSDCAYTNNDFSIEAHINSDPRTARQFTSSPFNISICNPMAISGITKQIGNLHL